MSINWRNSYIALQDFIKEHPSIQIDRYVMIIPDDVRSEFYRLFDEVRTGIIKNNFPGLLEEAAILDKKYAEAKGAVTALLNLKTIETAPRLGWFLNNPIEGLIHDLSDPLFDLLRDVNTADEFEERSTSIIKKVSRDFFHAGYRHWITLTLIQLLAPDKAYAVPLPDQFQEPELTDAETIPGINVHEMPHIVDSETLKMDISQYSPFISPNIVVYSTLLDAYAGIRDGYNNVYRRARAISKRVEWLKMEEIRHKFGTNALWPDLGIYLQGMKERLRILAGYFYAARPDITAEVISTDEWSADDAGKMARRHGDILKPRGGSFIISRTPPQTVDAGDETQNTDLPLSEGSHPEPETEGGKTGEEGPAEVKILVVGYDPDKLQPIIEELKKLEVTPATEEDELEDVYRI